jgi:hypothetical protein
VETFDLIQVMTLDGDEASLATKIEVMKKELENNRAKQAKEFERIFEKTREV